MMEAAKEEEKEMIRARGGWLNREERVKIK